MNEPIVAWTTPLQRAARKLYEVGEELELGSRAQAFALLRESLRQQRLLIQFLQANPKEGRKP